MTKTCSKCGTISSVYNSRDQHDRIWRRRFCNSPKCAHKWTTYEITEDLFNKLMDTQNKRDEIKALAESI